MKNSIKRASNLTLMFVMICLIISTGCESELTPEVTSVKFEMKATTSFSTLNARQKNSGLIFHEVLVGLVELEFETLEENESEDENGEESEDEIEFEGEFIVDLINGTSTPDFGIAEITPGIYEEIEIELGPVLENGNSIFIAFDLPQDGADPIRVEYSSNKEFEFELEDEVNGYQIDENSLNAFLVLMDLDDLFMNVDLGSAEIDTDGVIRINDNSNKSLATQIEENLDESFEAEEDEEDDEDD